MGRKITFFIILTIAVISVSFFFFIKLLYIKSWYSNITLVNELAPFEVINLLITSTVTIFIAWYITKKLSAQRYEKEFIISDLRKIEEQINYIEKTINSMDSIDLQQLLNLFNLLHSNIDRFNKTIAMLNISCEESKKLNTHYNKLYNQVTNVDGQTFVIDNANLAKIQKTCTNYIVTIRKIIYTINHL